MKFVTLAFHRERFHRAGYGRLRQWATLEQQGDNHRLHVHDTTIRIDARRKVIFKEALSELGLKASDEIVQALDLEQSINTATPKQLSISELQKAYAGKDVEPHRYGLLPLKQALHASPHPQIMAANFGGAKSIFGAEFDVAAAYAALAKAEGNTGYEQLECVGFNENTFAMEAEIRIKRPYGYNGGPCTHGSREYVTFWADLDLSGHFATCLGDGFRQRP